MTTSAENSAAHFPAPVTAALPGTGSTGMPGHAHRDGGYPLRHGRRHNRKLQRFRAVNGHTRHIACAQTALFTFGQREGK